MNDPLRTGAAHAPPPLLFHAAMRVLLHGRWKEYRTDTVHLLLADARMRAVQTSIVRLVGTAFATPSGFVRAYGSAMLDSSAEVSLSPSLPWPTPAAVTRSRLLHSIVMKGWQPREENNDFTYWKSTLGLCGQACVAYATELLEVEDFEVRDYLAGLAQGMAGAPSVVSAPSVSWLSPDFPTT